MSAKLRAGQASHAPVRVTTAAEASAVDAEAIRFGVPGFELMLQAGTVAAAELIRFAGPALAHGVVVLAGSGNNGGDGYVVAAQLARHGVVVTVVATSAPRTPDAQRARETARGYLPDHAFKDMHALSELSGCGVVVDALLGTGASGALRGHVADAAAWCNAEQAQGARVIALDVPTGVDATSGWCASGHVSASVTVSFGSCKVGLLTARHAVGRLVVVDIGLLASDHTVLLGQLATAAALRHQLPTIAWNAHKGTRGRVLVVGGTRGMAGAVRFAAEGALRSGAGLVRALVRSSSVAPLQSAVPAVVCIDWRAERAAHLALSDWADAVVIGPGLGRSRTALSVFRAALRSTAAGGAALILDADALRLLVRHWGMLHEPFTRCAATRPVLLTPHAGEFAALATLCRSVMAEATSDAYQRSREAAALARAMGCALVLKGTPTVCTDGVHASWFVPRGTPVLATGGTGDVLSGILAALLATEPDVAEAHAPATQRDTAAFTLSPSITARAAAAAWVHGVAAEHVSSHTQLRGSTVEMVLDALPDGFRALLAASPAAPGVLAVLPDVTAY